ncbi:GNAT family N-acetyltransferase [Cellulomonas sp. DKR-3]|uniref:GNAT family N-acetyltransferase n=1 Tax=Cellulomonas fulva TaxID=2835530 RepID=A0ABS5TWE0_9CELL|nr:GNAT family N-acetyltransferase [Cellulomonas fulva]MBT0993426.1 GNAT family N-acetyltransferase [Cellulomonas fulva]
MSSSIHGAPEPVRPRPSVHAEREQRATPRAGQPGAIPDSERAFFVQEFRGVTIVLSLPVLDDDALEPLSRTVRGFDEGDTRLVLVVADQGDAARLQARLHPALGEAAVLTAPTVWSEDALAGLWITATDARVVVVVAADPRAVAASAGFVAAGLGASKVVLTDPDGGWGDPPRSFVDLELHRDALDSALRERGDGSLLHAAETALRGGAFSVNLCRAQDIELELFTFDGTGTLLTLGGYVHLTELRVDDLPAVERLVAQGVADGVLKPRSREQVARMAVGGLGARVLRTGHLAGIVGLETEPYGRDGLGEVSALITVSEFSGAGSGGLLVDGLVERARGAGLRALFAVTVSDDAAAFFVRRGFREVPQDAVPASKWDGYDPERLAHARCFWFDLRP